MRAVRRRQDGHVSIIFSVLKQLVMENNVMRASLKKQFGK